MSSSRSLFSKTVAKKAKIDNEDKQEHTTSQNTGRNIPSTSVRKPAFNPALLSSAFYTGPTMYGGAGACSSSSPVNQYAKSKFYDRKKTDIKVTPSTPESSMSQTSRRILDLLEQYSSPISDAKRVPINNRPTFSAQKKTLNNSSIFDISRKSLYDESVTPNTSQSHRFRELQIPSMATLMKIKKNNLSSGNAQAAIMASMSSSLPYKPESYSLRSSADNKTYKNKIKTRISSRTNKVDEDEMALPVNLPNISLNMTGLPTFFMEPFKAQTSSCKPFVPDKQALEKFNSGSVTSNFKFTSPVSISKADGLQATRKFQFSEPLDIFSPDYVPLDEANTSGSFEKNSPVKSADTSYNNYSDSLSTRKSNKSENAPIVNFKSGDIEQSSKTSTKRPAEQWNGNDSWKTKDTEKSPLVNGDLKSSNIFGKQSLNKNDSLKMKDSSYDEILNPNIKKIKSDSPLPPSPISGLESFIKKQQEQWECSSCMTRNDQNKDKCICCEAPKPGATPAPKAISTPPYAGMSSFIKKQQEQWECSCCMTRNDQNRNKCVCCEASKPGCEPTSVAGINFNFGSTQNTFKFGIDKANEPIKPTSPSKTSSDELKKTEAAATIGTFIFGNTQAVADTKTDTVPVGGFKFGIPSSSSSIPKTESSSATTILPTVTFGSKQGESTPSAPVGGFTFGMKKSEENKIASPHSAPTQTAPPAQTVEKQTNLFSFSSPKSASDTTTQVEKPTNTFGTLQNDVKTSPIQTLKPQETPVSTQAATSVAKTAPAFTFGASQSSNNKPVFGNTAFQFGAPASSTTSPPSTDSNVKPPSLFTFGAKTATEESKPSVEVSKPTFSLPAPSGSMFSSVTAQVANNNKTSLPTIGTGLQFNAVSSVDKPKEQPAAPFFNFTSPSSNTPLVNNTFKSPSTSVPAFSFGSTSASKAETSVPLFNAPAASNPSAGIFGSKPSESNLISSSNTLFKSSPSTVASPFPTPSSGIFGSAPSVNSQLTPSTMFGSSASNPIASKPSAPVFGSSTPAVDPSQPQRTSSLFSNPAAPSSTFNAGNIFGNNASTGSAQPQPGNLFGNTANKASTEGGVGMFGSNPQPVVGPGNVLGAPTPGQMFGSSPSVPTPVFGASIPFGSASQGPAPQNVSFRFGAPSTAAPGAGFGAAPSAGEGAVFCFGSGVPAPAAPNSQFNFSMGAPSSAFPSTPGGPLAAPAPRRIKKAVRRNVHR